MNDFQLRMAAAKELADALTDQQAMEIEESMELVRMGKSGYFQEMAKLILQRDKKISVINECPVVEPSFAEEAVKNFSSTFTPIPANKPTKYNDPFFKWKWMMEYCRRTGMAPTRSVWMHAEKEWEKRKPGPHGPGCNCDQKE